MIHSTLLSIIGLLLVIFFLMLLGEKLRIAYPIFLVLGGLVIGFIPSIPDIEIDPNIVLLIFLPPLLYEASWNISWHDFWHHRLSISSLGFGLVIFTSIMVAYVSDSLIQSFSIPFGFLLGAIISPPDAIAATSILKSTRVPKTLLSVLKGESLVNDAASLTIFRFALIAITTSGSFVLREAVIDFFFVTFGGIAIGLGVALLLYGIHKILSANADIEVGLTLVSPYIMYTAAEYFHYSGVMAVVSGGLFLSYRYRDILNYESYMQAKGTWKSIAFLINGVVFLLIGLQLPVIINKMPKEILNQGIRYGLIISGIAIAIRILWVYLWTYIRHFIQILQKKSLPDPHWKGLFLIGWSGMRGVVSLAAALSIPLFLPNQIPFPNRDFIILITFVVILVTLVFQGLSLPLVIKVLKLSAYRESEQKDRDKQKLELQLLNHTRQVIDSKYKNIFQNNPLCQHYLYILENNIEMAAQKLNLICLEQASTDRDEYLKIMDELLCIQRRTLRTFRRTNMFDEELIRKKELELDLIETHLRNTEAT